LQHLILPEESHYILTSGILLVRKYFVSADNFRVLAWQPKQTSSFTFSAQRSHARSELNCVTSPRNYINSGKRCFIVREDCRFPFDRIIYFLPTKPWKIIFHHVAGCNYCSNGRNDKLKNINTTNNTLSGLYYYYPFCSIIPVPGL